MLSFVHRNLGGIIVSGLVAVRVIQDFLPTTQALRDQAVGFQYQTDRPHTDRENLIDYRVRGIHTDVARGRSLQRRIDFLGKDANSERLQLMVHQVQKDSSKTAILHMCRNHMLRNGHLWWYFDMNVVEGKAWMFAPLTKV
jgi:hypothetical protein